MGRDKVNILCRYDGEKKRWRNGRGWNKTGRDGITPTNSTYPMPTAARTTPGSLASEIECRCSYGLVLVLLQDQTRRQHGKPFSGPILTNLTSHTTPHANDKSACNYV